MYILMLSLHGLLRGGHPELGRDSDTGGQILYVLELARALGRHPRVTRVDLLTRRIDDPTVDKTYSCPEEPLGGAARIVRIPCGPARYLRKESLWPYLDAFADQVLQHVRRVGQAPAAVHGHYADAGLVAAQVASTLGVPCLFTGHSLGRVKRERLLARGQEEAVIERRYRLTQRIEAEEQALESADAVVVSTRQEIDEQYVGYHRYQPAHMRVIPPGVDLSRFRPPGRDAPPAHLMDTLRRFLRDPNRPMVLAIARPDERKNLQLLVDAFGTHESLRAKANLVVVAGNRDDIADLDPGPRRVMGGLLAALDRHDLYGRLALPKHHQPSDIPELYRLATRTGGVFVNPALTEPFGLTLLEAAASGLPVVATQDGGPAEIIRLCRNGVLVNPLEPADVAAGIHGLLTDRTRWDACAQSGLQGVRRHYSWDGHVAAYIRLVRELPRPRTDLRSRVSPRDPLIHIDRLLVTDIDDTLVGDRKALQELRRRLRSARSKGMRVGFGVATGRTLPSALEILRQWGVPPPDIVISAVGTEIHYGPRLAPDAAWQRHIQRWWRPERIPTALAGLPGLTPQPESEQRPCKISYFIDPATGPSRRTVVRMLRQAGLPTQVVVAHGRLLDILPLHGGKGRAIRWLAHKWGLAPERILVAGDSGNDEDMLAGFMPAVVVANHSPELERLRGRPRVFFAPGAHARGILDALTHYDFLGTLSLPGDEEHPA